jgi:hypothetical protein
MSHKGLMLCPICQKLLLKSVLTILKGLKHGEHPFGHLLPNSCLLSLLSCQVSLLLGKRLKNGCQGWINRWRSNTGTTGLMIMETRWHRRRWGRWRYPEILNIWIKRSIDNGTLILELANCLILISELRCQRIHYSRSWSYVLRSRAVGSKWKSSGVESRLNWGDQISCTKIWQR